MTHDINFFGESSRPLAFVIGASSGIGYNLAKIGFEAMMDGKADCGGWAEEQAAGSHVQSYADANGGRAAPGAAEKT